MSLPLILASAAVMAAGSVLLFLRRGRLAPCAACESPPVTMAVEPAA